MNHVAILEAAGHAAIDGKDVHRRATGRFYTPQVVAERLAAAIAPLVPQRRRLTLIDPFGGDGRLLCWLMQELVGMGVERVEATVWEQDAAAAPVARERLAAEGSRLGLEVGVDVWTGDTFNRAAGGRERFDVVLTNPPWELLKPDQRELRTLPAHLRDSYVAELRAFDQRLASEFPISQPSRRFAGWGTNLSRVGTEVALRLTGEGGVCGLVTPSSLLADTTSAALRRWMLDEFALVEVTHWPAEARLFEGVDVPCLSFVAVRGTEHRRTRLVRIRPDRTVEDEGEVRLDKRWLSGRQYAIPAAHGAGGVHLLRRLDAHSPFAALEGRGGGELWAGRELDETRRRGFTRPSGKRPFVRSAHIGRLRRPALPSAEFLDVSRRAAPASADEVRLVWRDISRPSQRRRVQATLLPAGPVTGNSVNVAHFRDGDLPRLLALLGFVSSMPFEFQVRSLLMTNHLSLSAMRAGRLPSLDGPAAGKVATATAACLEGEPGAEARLERAAAEAYGLDRETLGRIADAFRLEAGERDALDEAWRG